MAGLIIKNSFFFAAFLLLYCAGGWLYWGSTRTALDLSMIVTHVSFMFVMVPFPIYLCELAESKANGYRFLDTLPLTSREIVASKMALAPATLAVFIACSIFMFSRFEGNAGMARFGRAALLAASPLCLAECGLLYMGIYRFGFQRFSKFMLAALVIGYLSPVAANDLLVPLAGLDEEKGAAFARAIDGRAFALAAIFLYAALWAAASSLKGEKRDV